MLCGSIHHSKDRVVPHGTTWGKPSDPVHRVRPKSSGRYWKGFQQSRWGLGGILGPLTNLTFPTHLLAGLTHVWPPHTLTQQGMHLLGTKVSSKLCAVNFIQQQLPTRSRHHQPGSFTCTTYNNFNPMSATYMKQSMGSTCSSYQLLHLSIRLIKSGRADTCQEGWFHNQRGSMSTHSTIATWRPT